jgi:hypothetical protein
MPVGPQRFRYPQTPEEARGTPFERVHRAYGAGDPSAVFGTHPKSPPPWPAAGRTRDNPLGYDPNLVQAALKAPEQHMEGVDPRHLHSTQPWVTRAGVDYYQTPEYRETGRTFADIHQASNRHPIVYRDSQGRNKILTGHHRATAALLSGELFHGLLVEELSE